MPVQGLMREKATGLPRREAASTRRGRFDSGQVPVQAARVSEVASQVRSGSEGWNFERSRPAAANSGFQSICEDVLGGLLLLVGNSLEIKQAALGIQLKTDHTGQDGRWVLAVHYTRSQQVVVITVGG